MIPEVFGSPRREIVGRCLLEKAILEVAKFLTDLERKEHKPIERPEAKEAESTALALLEVARDRIVCRAR